MKDIINALGDNHFETPKWFQLGLQLGLLQPTLASIRTKYRDNPEECLQECLTKWLKGVDKVGENGGPTVDSLVSALKRIEEVSTAEKITHLLSEDIVFDKYHSFLMI